jgi:MamL-1 domain
MGDFMPPGRGCVGTEYERQRRRFERYRQLHAIRRQQFDNFATSAYSQQLHETQMLHKKWLESVSSKKPSAAKSAGKLQQRNDAAQLALPPGSQPTGVPPTSTVSHQRQILAVVIRLPYVVAFSRSVVKQVLLMLEYQSYCYQTRKE